jgi:hypothetical protein
VECLEYDGHHTLVEGTLEDDDDEEDDEEDEDTINAEFSHAESRAAIKSMEVPDKFKYLFEDIDNMLPSDIFKALEVIIHEGDAAFFHTAIKVVGDMASIRDVDGLVERSAVSANTSTPSQIIYAGRFLAGWDMVKEKHVEKKNVIMEMMQTMPDFNEDPVNICKFADAFMEDADVGQMNWKIDVRKHMNK